MSTHKDSPKVPNPNPLALCFALGPSETTVVCQTRASPGSTTETQRLTQGQCDGGSKGSCGQYMLCMIGAFFKSLLSCKIPVSRRHQAKRIPVGTAQWVPIHEASMRGYRINPRSGRGHLFPKCHFQNFYFCNIHAGDIFYNGVSSLTIGRGESIICNRLLKLSDENGEVTNWHELPR